VPSAQAFAARERTATQRYALGQKAGWTAQDKDETAVAARHFPGVAAACVAELLEVLERRSLRIGSLTLWRELGQDALDLLRPAQGIPDV